MQTINPSNLDDPCLYINRDLSWLEFNRRVLEEAQDSTVPLLERLKFLAIFSSNLDEFFMVRVGGTQQKVTAGIPTGSGADQTSPKLQLETIRQTVAEEVAEQYRCLTAEILPALQERGISIYSANDLSENQRRHVRDLFRREIFPILTPLATDPAHPFPHLLNKSLNVAVSLHRPGDTDTLYAVVQVPSVMPRFVALPTQDANAVNDEKEKAKSTSITGDGSGLLQLLSRTTPCPLLHAFIPLEEVIRLHLSDLFPGMELGKSAAFRVTRDSEYELDDEVDDLLEEIEAHVKARRRGQPVRMEIESSASPDLEQFLSEGLKLAAADVYKIPGPIDLTGLFQIYGVPGFADLRDPPFVPAPIQAFAQSIAPWAAFRGRDILMFHPFESFAPVVDFVAAAAADDRVLAIKQTLYRTSQRFTHRPRPPTRRRQRQASDCRDRTEGPAG